MLRLPLCLSVLALLFCAAAPASPAQAQEANRSQAAVIDTLLAYSEVGTIAEARAGRFERLAETSDLRLEPAAREALLAEARAALDSTTLTRYVRDHFEAQFRPELAAEAVRGLRSAAAQRVESAARGSDAEALSAYAQALQENRPSRERVQLVQRFAKAQRATQFYVDGALRTNRVVAEAAQALGDDGAPGRLRPDRAELQRQARAGALVSFLYRFQDVTQEDLEEYTRFYESEAGQWYVRTYGAAINQAMERAGAALGDALEGRAP